MYVYSSAHRFLALYLDQYTPSLPGQVLSASRSVYVLYRVKHHLPLYLPPLQSCRSSANARCTISGVSTSLDLPHTFVNPPVPVFETADQFLSVPYTVPELDNMRLRHQSGGWGILPSGDTREQWLCLVNRLLCHVTWRFCIFVWKLI